MPLKRFADAAMIVVLGIAGVDAAGPDLRVVEAVRARNTGIVAALLRQGADVNAAQGDGATALHWAAYWDDAETAARLIGAGARVNARTDLGATPLSVASVHGGAGLIQSLLEAGADPNAALPSGETALMAASRTGTVEAVRALLTHGANPNTAERLHGQTALMWAAAERHPAVVQVLLEHGADFHARSSVRQRIVKLKGSPIRSNSVGVVEEDQGGFTPLLFAARQGDLASAQLLLDAGADVNDTAPTGTSVLLVAAHSGHVALTTFLLDHGADPNAAGAGYTALHAAVLRGDKDSVTTLLAHGANPNVVLTRATPARRSSIDWAMSEAWIGATPFWLAAKFGEHSLMRTLLAHGADPLVRSRNGMTALMAAIDGVLDRWGLLPADGYYHPAPDPDVEERTIVEALGMIVALGGDVNAVNDAGDTALHQAASRHLESVVRFLADHGAWLDAKNKRGQTPLAVASTRRVVDAAIEKVTKGDLDHGGKRSGPRTAALLRELGAKE